MQISKKILNMLIFLFGMMIFFCLISFKLGYSGIFLVGEVSIPITIEKVIRFLMFGLQTFLLYSYILNIYDPRKLFMLFLPYFTMHIGIECYYQNMITSSVMPILYVLILALKNKTFKLALKRTFFISGVLVLYQLFIYAVKIGYTRLGYNELNTYEWLVVSIDLLLLILLVYAKGGVEYAKWQLVLYPADVCNASHSDDCSQDSQEYFELSGYERVFAMSTLLVVQLVQWSIILFACHLGHVYLEGLVISTSFIAHGWIIQRRKHMKNVTLCTLTSAAIFYVSAKLTIAFHYSQFFPILVGLGLVYTMYRVAVHLDTLADKLLQTKIERLQKLEKEMQVAWQYIDKLTT